MKRVRNGKQWKEGHAATETHVFDRIYIIPPTVRFSVKGLYLSCEGQLHSLE
jgi:hypothetical protein